MGILSRTLQTLLNKYLLEVDVEGVAMPSLIDVDGQSGWGVRLCNVRLREGVELMTLPGKRTVKKKRMKNKKRGKGSSNSVDAVGQTSGSSANDDAKDQRSGEKKNNLGSGVESETVQPSNDRDQLKRSPRSRLMSEDTEVESALSSRVPSPSVMCRTSVRSAVTGCLSRGRSAVGTANDDNEVETPTAPSTMIDQHVVFDTNGLEADYSIKPTELFKPIKGEEWNVKAIAVETVIDDGQHNNNGKVEEEDEEDEEEEDYTTEEDMILFLGKGGRIGTLDVRLVGKEFHIMVEDAFLTVEACPKQEESDDASSKTAATADTTKDDGSKAKKRDTKKEAKPSLKKEGATAGERVLDNSTLARAISAIPHLLLRDVRVRLVIRNKAQEPDAEITTEIGTEDSVVEVNIEMLSVASGEDFLENFGDDSASKVSPSMDDSSISFSARQRVSLQVLEERDENEYLFKRIRTGKGPEGGISVKVYPPTKKKRIVPRADEMQGWAFQSYANRAQFRLFQCSGVDIRTRIFLGKQKEVAIRNNDYAWYGDEYDEYTMDSMLYGVDYIAPAPPPLPPLKKKDSFTFAKKVKPEIERFMTDENGIQSNSVKSCFHKVARGLTPMLCSKDHLPTENCPYCWEDTTRPNSYSEHPFDSRTPLPGIVINVEFTEPIELNVDRSTLEVIGSIYALFAKKPDAETVADVEISKKDERPEMTSITQKLKNLAFRKKEKKEILREAFPSYMKPETIEIMGLYVSRIILRVHVMKKGGIYDQGLEFRYWETMLRCATVDMQMHTSKERIFHDIRCDLGYLVTNDCFGVERKQLLSLGMPLRDTSDSDSISLSNINPIDKSTERTCWPNTAAILLQVPIMTEASDFESRESHGLQIRILSIGGNDVDVRNATMNARVGVLAVELPRTLPTDIETMVNQTVTSIFGPTGLPKNSPPVQTEDTTTMPILAKYAVRLDGGHFMWSPLVQVRLPVLKLGGEVSSDKEIFLETILNHVKLQYGKRSTLLVPQSKLSLVRMAQLPEEVRMRILFFLNDLGPLEKALGIPRERNSFLRCRAVNKGIVKVAKRSTIKNPKRKKGVRMPSDPTPTRQGILDELSKLDEHALGELWATHKNRSKNRMNRTRSNSDR